MAFSDLSSTTFKTSADQRKEEEARELQLRWVESEHTLGILRTKGTNHHLPRKEAMAKWMAGIREQGIPLSSNDPYTEPHPHTPSQWFKERFPEARNFGNAFWERTETTSTPTDGMTSRIIPTKINEDFFAAILGGSRKLGHEMIYYLPERTFLFHDPLSDAFCPTTSEKIHLLLSNLLVRCAGEMGPRVDVVNLVVGFRQPGVLKAIVRKAEALLAAERGFFHAGRKRIVGAKVVENGSGDAMERFVKGAIKPDPDARLTVTECYETYRKFCGAEGFEPVARQYFKGLIREVIEEEFGRKVRHDLLTESGKRQNGWRGLAVDPLALAA